ncbi:serine/threonine protein kinase [Glaciihabitans tibetensis]|uniref:non-specific serine/threonine protein kinase n=1 Tax=Glaciihabitans tibetensis TaxID=1266600 RepID=A0A2T0VD63_9MICO|nr:serine/threonine-protein kinase [Glaciihabitans tibetensis]PRY68110.1 serine/threonine protein kinase [Glaciihabitans tibetensis]
MVGARLPSAPPVLSGYSYIRPLGAGGFADVFLFQQNMPRRSVAVKVLLQNVVDSDVLRMFNAEADVMASLSAHPSILTVYNASISADGRPYLVMEFCPGSLASRYRREQLPVAEVLHVAVKIACALETAHRSGVLHRDIKPSNILTTSFGSPVLSDFGIAASLGSSNQEQLFAMSVPWSAPEIVEERTTGTVASEVWGFGATIYSLLAGRTPFEQPSVKSSRSQLAQRISRAKYTPLGRADVPDSLEQVLARTMSRLPEHRQLTLLECATQLQRVQHEMGLAPTPLEVAGDEWATAGSPIDFENTVMRGAVISEVQPASPRRRVAKTRVNAARSMTGEGTVIVGADSRRVRASTTTLTLLVSAGAVVGIAATAFALFATGVF